MIWIDPFLTLLGREFAGQSPVATLATVTPAGRAAARCLVLRETFADGTLCFTTDTRSEKVDDLRHTPFAEAVFWLPQQRRQFRIAGEARIDTDPIHTLRVWSALSEETRRTFVGLSPGLPRSDKPAVIAPTASPPTVDLKRPQPNFALLLLIPERVESLDLTATPHERVRWSTQTDWQAKYINP